MASDAPRQPLWQRALRWAAVVLLVLVGLLALVLFGIDTGPGHRLIADQIGEYVTPTGLNIKVGRIEGSIYGRMMLDDVRVADPKGVFATSPRLDVDWRPFAYIRNHIDVRSLTTALVTVSRSPLLKVVPTDKNAPILPDIDIGVDRLRVDRLILAKAVTGQTHVIRIDGGTHIAHRRAQVNATAIALRGPGVAGGDRLALTLDAVPDADRLALDVKLTAPKNGVVAALAGLSAPLAVSIDGRGSWASWQGKARAVLGQGDLADLDLQEHAGQVAIRGTARPGLYSPGTVERLTGPAMAVALDATLGDRKADTRLKLRSPALAVDGGGVIDLATNQFGNFAIDAQLLTPGAIMPGVSGRDVLARFVLNGVFGTPTVDYKLRAATLGFGTTVAQGVYAEGLARVDTNRILLPVHARARRLLGLNPAIGGLADNARIDGDLAITMPNIVSDNLRIRTDKIDATAVLVANVATGRYTGALKGRVNNYRVDGIGIVDVTTDAHLVPGQRGGFGIAGRVLARTEQVFNSGVRDFLGGNAIVRSDVAYTPQGIVTFSGLRMNAPLFRVTRGQGRYDPANGAVLVDADAYSATYGPVFARVTGSAAAPVVALRAPKPGLGVGLANVNARIVGRGGAYAVTATGGSAYGPFSADVLVNPTPRLAIDVRRLLFAGVVATGRVVATATGPFAGALRFAGQGLTGDVALAAQGKYQRADIAARALNARVPGQSITIGRALASASVVLYPTAPQIIADVQLGDTRYNGFVIQAARAKVNYVGGRGTAQALLTGSTGVPLRVAVNAQLSPGHYLAVAQGQANGINFHTTPATIDAVGSGYRLSPTRIEFDNGSARIAGSYGGGTTSAQVRLDRLDLAILSAFAPGLGLSGKVNGSLDLHERGSAVPEAVLNATVTGFQRTGLAAVSEPVDVVVAGQLAGAGGELRALVKRGAVPVGRLVATVLPLPPGGLSAIMQAPLSGGIRYNGPSAVLFSLAALPNQALNGPIAIAADFSGRVGAPQLNGLIRADNLTYDNETYGTRLSQLKVAAQFTNDRLVLSQATARAGTGSVSAQGTVGLAAASGFPIDLTVKFDRAQLARSDALAATSSGSLHLTHQGNAGLIQGTITLPEARYEIIRQGAAEVPELTGVRRRSAMVAGQTPPPAPDRVGTVKLDVRVRADNQLFVSGLGLESEWGMDMRIGGTSVAPQVTGGLDLVRGTYSFAGKRFDLSKGQIRFRGGALTDPDINIEATTTTADITAVLDITGTGNHPQIAFSSTPALPQDEVLSRLLFGASPANLSATEAIQLAAALNSLRGSGGGLNPLGKLRSALGFDRLRVLSADQSTGQGTSLAAGKYITRNIYIEIVTDAKGMTATQIQVALTKALSLLSSAGSVGGTNAALRYNKDY